VRSKGTRTLVVYWNPYGNRVRHTTAAHLRAVCAAPSGAVFAVNAHRGLPAALRRLEPTAVILHTTFLGLRWLQSFARRREQAAWIGSLGCPVLALPQDDFDHAAVLDEWLDGLGVTHLYTALAAHAETLYPRTIRRAGVFSVLTGYVDPVAASMKPRAGGERTADVVYRATRLPYWFGGLGRLKAEVGEQAAAVAGRHGLRADVSLDPQDAITGAEWLRFLAGGRTVVGCESGSSVVDPDGSVRREIEAMLLDEPGLSYEEVSARMPVGWDDHWFGVVSPRHLEAAAAGTPQVLVEGRYSDVLIAHVHYAPVRRDLRDLADVLLGALEPDAGRTLAARARADIVDSGAYAFSRLTEALRGALPCESGDRRRAGDALANAVFAGWNAYARATAALGVLRGRRRR
jgi:hypothetical protein